MSLQGNTALLEQLSQILDEKTTGGVTLPELTNPGDASKLLQGYELIGQNGEVVTGEIASKGAADLTASGAAVTVPAGYYPARVSKSVATATQATPTITVSSGGLITAQASQSAGYVSAGSKSATKQLTTQAAQTITAGTTNKTIASGRYLTGTQTIKGDANLKAENIVKGVSIFGVAGSAETGGGTPTLETCDLSVEIWTNYEFAVSYITVENGQEVPHVETDSQQFTVNNLKKGSLVSVYAPNNSSDGLDPAITLIGHSSDYTFLAYQVTGNATIQIS